MILVLRFRWKLLAWRLRAHDFWASLPERWEDLRARLKGERRFAMQPLCFGDSMDGSASQKHAILESVGLFGWRKTGIEFHWRRLGQDGGWTETFLYREEIFDTFAEALEAYDGQREEGR